MCNHRYPDGTEAIVLLHGFSDHLLRGVCKLAVGCHEIISPREWRIVDVDGSRGTHYNPEGPGTACYYMADAHPDYPRVQALIDSEDHRKNCKFMECQPMGADRTGRPAMILERLRAIANRAGRPTMGYCPQAAMCEQRETLNWIAKEAAQAIKELSETQAGQELLKAEDTDIYEKWLYWYDDKWGDR